jgi:DNA-binding transcriptional ArsR family regulator
VDNLDDLSPVFERVSSYFALLSEPMRIRILHVVCQHEQTVGAIVSEVGGTQANVSRHLGQMYRAGALSRRKQGNHTYYSVADAALVEICRSVCVHIAGNLDASEQRKDLMVLANDLGAGI